MKSLRRFLREAFDKGGVLVVGLGCLILYKQQYIPNVLGPLSYGMISAGAIAFARYIIMDYDTPAENEDYQKLLAVIDQRQKEIQADRAKLEELKTACESFMSMREILEGWRRDPSLVQDKITILEELLKRRDCDTSLLASKGSTQCNISGMMTEQSSSPSQKETDTGSEDVGETGKKNLEHFTRGNVSEEELEQLLQKLLQEASNDLLEEVSESVLDESEKVLEDISENMRKEICERLQAELPGNEQCEIPERSVEEIMEKVQMELFQKVQEGIVGIVGRETFELLQEDTPEEDQDLVKENVQDDKPQTIQMKTEEKQNVITLEGGKDTAEKQLENIPSEQLDEQSKNLVQEKSENKKDNTIQESLQLGLGDLKEKQQLHGMVSVELKKSEQEDQEKLEKEIAEALLEAESERIVKP